ncbi:MAG: hypothetical protein ACRDJH_27655 [Thermomicrobiales bacterium]
MASRSVSLAIDPASEIEQLRRRTHFRGGDDVSVYLERHSGITHVLVGALDRISEYFGEDVPIALEVLWDPEEPEHDELYALIQTSLAAEDAVSRLKRFDEAWWLHALDHTHGGLTISLEFV